MRRPGTTTTFVLICIAALLASYGIGLGIKQYRFRNADNQSKIPGDKTEQQNPTAPKVPQRGPINPAGSNETGGPRNRFTNRPGGRPQDGETGRRRPFENTSEEDTSQMRRGPGRRGPGGTGLENLSEEEREAMAERRRQRIERFENMTEEERAQFRRERGVRRQDDDITDDTSDPGSEENDSE